MRFREKSLHLPKRNAVSRACRVTRNFCGSVLALFCFSFLVLAAAVFLGTAGAASAQDEMFTPDETVPAYSESEEEVVLSALPGETAGLIGPALLAEDGETVYAASVAEHEGLAVSGEVLSALQNLSSAENTGQGNVIAVEDVNRFSQESSPSPRYTAITEEEFPEEDDKLFTMEADRKGNVLTRIEKSDLDPRFELFENFDGTAAWASTVEEEMCRAFGQIERDPVAARMTLRRLSNLVVKNSPDNQALLLPEEIVPAEQHSAEQHSNNRNSLFRFGENGFSPAASSDKYASSVSETAETGMLSEKMSEPVGLALYAPEERVEIYRGFRYALDRRIYLWAAAADYFEYAAGGGIRNARSLTKQEVSDLKAKTEAVRNYFGVSDVGQKWRKSFEVDSVFNLLNDLEEKMSGGTVFKPFNTAFSGDSAAEDAGTDAEERLLRDHANSICRKVESSCLTLEQMKVFQTSPGSDWYQGLRLLTSDQTDPYKILDLYEVYEQGGGGDIGRELGQTAYRMKTSPSPSCRKFGEAVYTIYNNPNLKVYISQVFINRFLPIRDPEFDVVQEHILGNPVAGSRRTDTQVRIQLVPDPNRILMNLVVTGRVIASTHSEVFPAKIFNESYANYSGVKEIEWGNEGLSWNESQVDVNNINRLSDVRTNVDFVPIVGNLTREMVKGEYQARQESLRIAAQEKIGQEVKRRIDTESSVRFQTMNENLSKNFFGRLDKLGLTLSLQNAQTTQDWILASMRLSEPGSLGSQTIEPPTVGGAFADLKVHESAVNTFLSRLEINGKSWTPEELAGHVAAKFGKSAPKFDYGDIFLEFGMKPTDPVSVSFGENRVKLRLRFDYIEFGDQGWDNVEVTVTYLADLDETGTPFLVRDGVIGISGPMNIRAQIPLRGMFSKIFQQDKKIQLHPRVFDRDERFAGLSTGLCRVKNGWFAISVTEKESGVQVSEYPRLKAFRERLAKSRQALREWNFGPEATAQALRQNGVIR